MLFDSDIKRQEYNKHKVICIGNNKFYEKFIVDYRFIDINFKGELYYCLELKYNNGKTYIFKLVKIDVGMGSSDCEEEPEKEIYNCLIDKCLDVKQESTKEIKEDENNNNGNGSTIGVDTFNQPWYL